MNRAFSITCSSEHFPSKLLFNLRFSQGKYDAAKEFAKYGEGFDPIPGGVWVNARIQRFTLINFKLNTGVHIYVEELT